MEKSYYKNVKKTKNIDEFYKSSLSRCKGCRKKCKNEELYIIDDIQ